MMKWIKENGALWLVRAYLLGAIMIVVAIIGAFGFLIQEVINALFLR